MVNFLPHMDLIPIQTQNRINLLMGSAEKHLKKQFEEKLLYFELNQQKTEEARQELKQKEKQLLDTIAELNWAKSALNSGELKELLEKLPGLLMETADKTLIKQEAALLTERGGSANLSARNASSRGCSPRQNNSVNMSNMSGISSLRMLSPTCENYHPQEEME